MYCQFKCFKGGNEKSMNKIEELAEKYAQEAYNNPVDRNVGKADFIVGANYVLEIFKEIIENRNFCAFPKAVHQELLDKIKELKGE